MTRRTMLDITLATVCAILFASASHALAHEGHDHKVMGTVTMAAPDHVMLKDKTGKEVTIQLTPETKILKDKTPVKIDEVKPGTRVVVTATMDAKNNMKAKIVEVGSVPASK